MGKKTKVGKQRKDKYYQLAKETGYRSRAAFKLIQLNRKFGFLQKSRVCIDLCAAPGGWMQVAHQNMPLSSIVIGVDLFPIKPVPGCIALTEDITTDKCKSAISKEIKTWKADVVLHDGAPNVGLNWLHDAYQQAVLTLSALKLATHFLAKGGWFVTKVFRSKDYNALMWVFKQLFKKVHATKPQASRNESSEIFVLCQGFIAPDSLDPKFLDPKYVFEDLEIKTRNNFNLLHPEKQKKAKAEGYKENDYTLHHKISITKFLESEDEMELLKGCSEITIDDPSVISNPLTTKEIAECCKDIKVLGRKDLRILLHWIKVLKEQPTPKSEEKIEAIEGKDGDESKDEDEEIDKELAGLQEEERRETKRKRKQLNKQRQKLAEKMNLKMVLKGDDGPVAESNDMFRLDQLKSAKQIDKLIDRPPDMLAEPEDSDDEMKLKPKYLAYDVNSKLDSSGTYYKDSDSELEMESDSEVDESKEDLGFSDEDNISEITRKNTIKNSKSKVAKKNPLLTDLDNSDANTKKNRMAELWYEKDSFKDLDDAEDEDVDLDKLADTYIKKGKKVLNKEPKKNKKRPHKEESSSESSDSDYDVQEHVAQKKAGKNSEDFEVVPQDESLKKLKKSLKMDAETLALGTMIATSKKMKRDLIDDGWNRYMFQDKNLPDWFVQDEAINMRKPVAVPEEMSAEYKKRLQEIDARPIKKVIEAKARKKKRAIKKMERAKKKIESVMENTDMSEQEKSKQVKTLLRKAKSEGKKEITYIVAKKHSTGQRVRRPAGVKGRYKVVDSRMKKDLRAAKAKEKTKNRSSKAKRNGNKPSKSKGRKVK